MFLRRMQHVNPATKAPFTADELVPGTVIKLPNAVIQIMDPSEAKILPVGTPRGDSADDAPARPTAVTFATPGELGWSGAAAIEALEAVKKKLLADEMTSADLLAAGTASRSANTHVGVSLEEFNRRLDAILGPALLAPESAAALHHHIQGIQQEDEPNGDFWEFFARLVFDDAAWKVATLILRARALINGMSRAACSCFSAPGLPLPSSRFVRCLVKSSIPIAIPRRPSNLAALRSAPLPAPSPFSSRHPHFLCFNAFGCHVHVSFLCSFAQIAAVLRSCWAICRSSAAFPVHGP